MVAYHEISPPALESALQDGLKCSLRGEKGKDSAIAQTDEVLERYKPEALAEAKVSRHNNLYAYMARGERIVRITDGALVEVKEFIAASSQALLCLSVEPWRCFVSDLDAFDRVKKAIEAQRDKHAVASLCQAYWAAVTSLTRFQFGSVHRPEIMITYDVPPACIEVVSRGPVL